MEKSFSYFIKTVLQLCGFIGLSYVLLKDGSKAICLGLILNSFFYKLDEIHIVLNNFKKNKTHEKK